MRIGFVIPSDWSLVRGHGVVAQARLQAEALESIGHSVELLNPWKWQDLNELDVLQFFGPCALYPAMHERFPGQRHTLIAYAPIIDSNQSFSSYRLAAALGSLSPRMSTIPGIIKAQAQHCDVVICRSQHELERVTQSLSVSEAKAEIVLNGCSAPVMAAGDGAAMDALQLPEDFILHVSAFTQERKNVLRLARAAGELQIPLVVAGRSTPSSILDELQQRIRNGQPIVLLGFVDEATKAALYSRCRVFCLPSLHEGTGLVAVEAASYGANLVITRNGGPPDYFLDMADYVNPFDLADLKRALASAWARPKDDRLRDHVTRTLTWGNSARSLADVYVKHRGNLA